MFSSESNNQIIYNPPKIIDYLQLEGRKIKSECNSPALVKQHIRYFNRYYLFTEINSHNIGIKSIMISSYYSIFMASARIHDHRNRSKIEIGECHQRLLEDFGLRNVSCRSENLNPNSQYLTAY